MWIEYVHLLFSKRSDETVEIVWEFLIYSTERWSLNTEHSFTLFTLPAWWLSSAIFFLFFLPFFIIIILYFRVLFDSANIHLKKNQPWRGTHNSPLFFANIIYVNFN